ncbi:MAG: hydantoinase/oxoprolinase family protein, partial [Alphaproteobacteria bacterium]
MSATRYSIGIDTGGTFTDVVARGSDGSLRLAKVPSTRADPGEAVRQVIGEVLAEWGIAPQSVKRFVHGTTVATNAVLERKGARIGLIATEGFTDVIEIGRQNRRQIYELLLEPETPAFLAPGSRRVGVTEGGGPDGVIETPLDEASLAAAVERLQAEGVEAVAVCLLFAFANPEHERRIGAYLRERFPDLPVSLSSEVDPAFREYERTCVTAFDAYVKPRLDRYLGRMQADLDTAGIPAALQIMQSRGGICSSEVARRRPVRLFLSGPAAGVIGACAAGAAVGARDLVTIDIGGTRSDIALISDGKPLIRPEGLLDSFTIRVPMVDVNAIGAGGGSIAWIDAGGGLRVGPESAGADPGPACYGRGGRDATVTDASVALGYLDPDYFAGGALALDAEKAREAIRTRVAGPLNLTLDEAALVIHRVVNAQMAEGIRLVSISRGVDPRAFTLVALGGGGPVHATALADELGMSRVVVPRYPGVLSADGLLAAAIENEASTAFPKSLAETDMAEVRATFDRLDRECDAQMALERLDGGTVERSYHADVC